MRSNDDELQRLRRLVQGPYEPMSCRGHWHVSVGGMEVSEGAFGTREDCQARCDELNARQRLEADTAYWRGARDALAWIHATDYAGPRSTPASRDAWVENVIKLMGPSYGP
jgi:hypothetical protein